MTEFALYGVNPTYFNFASDVVALVVRTILGSAIAYISTILLSWHLRRGQGIPVTELGQPPADAWKAVFLATKLRYSIPAILFVTLLVIGDFSHSLADVGLQFKTVERKGPLDTVLDLTKRNRKRLYPLAGDPLTERTEAWPDNPMEERLLASYLQAVSSMAQGISPLTRGHFEEIDIAISSNPKQFQTTWHGLPTHYATTKNINKPLAETNQTIPLICGSTEMVEMHLIIVEIAKDYDKQAVMIENTGLLPNCTLTTLRTTGIHNFNSTKAKIVEVAYSGWSYFGWENDTQIEFLVDQKRSRWFWATAEMRKLARDRKHWKRVRVIETDMSLHYGDDLKVVFDTVVLATGVEETTFTELHESNGASLSPSIFPSTSSQPSISPQRDEEDDRSSLNDKNETKLFDAGSNSSNTTSFPSISSYPSISPIDDENNTNKIAYGIEQNQEISNAPSFFPSSFPSIRMEDDGDVFEKEEGSTRRRLQTSQVKWRTYGLVAKVNGTCPDRPSGEPIDGLDCVVIMGVSCQAFPEDYEIWDVADEDKSCEMWDASFVWVDGINVDHELVAVMAGLYGIVKPTTYRPKDLERFITYAPLAALFALGSVDVAPSVESAVSPVINWIYIVFMVIPIITILIVFVVGQVTRHLRISFPTSTWELLTWGREMAEIPKRADKSDSFPPDEEGLNLIWRSTGEIDVIRRGESRPVHRLERNGSTDDEEDFAFNDEPFEETRR